MSVGRQEHHLGGALVVIRVLGICPLEFMSATVIRSAFDGFRRGEIALEAVSYGSLALEDDNENDPDLEEGRQHLLAVDVPQKYIGPKMAVKNLNRQTDKGELILSGVSIEVTEGTVVGIIGPSGSGKSTLLRALNRLWEPPSDSVFLDGEDVTKLNVISVRRRVGMLFQTPTLFDGTVADNIRYGPGLQGKKLNDGEVEEFLRQADLEPFFAQKSVIGLSVGQAQRVALARTLANAPEVLLLDEPTSALDPVSTQHIENSIHNLCKRRGLTVVIVSHSIKQIQKIADIVYLLVKGEVVEMLKPTELSKATHPLALEFLEAS